MHLLHTIWLIIPTHSTYSAYCDLVYRQRMAFLQSQEIWAGGPPCTFAVALVSCLSACRPIPLQQLPALQSREWPIFGKPFEEDCYPPPILLDDTAALRVLRRGGLRTLLRFHTKASCMISNSGIRRTWTSGPTCLLASPMPSATISTKRNITMCPKPPR